MYVYKYLWGGGIHISGQGWDTTGMFHNTAQCAAGGIYVRRKEGSRDGFAWVRVTTEPCNRADHTRSKNTIQQKQGYNESKQV